MTDNIPQTQAPENPDSTARNQGTVAQGLAGDYQLDFSGVIKEAWETVSGNKGTLWIGLAIYIVAHVALSFVLGLFLGGDEAGEGLADTLATVITLPLGAGLMLLGAALASGRTPNPTSMLSWYHRFLQLALTWVLMSILILLGTLLLVLPGIYLAISYQLALPLVADKGLGAWEAMETSRKTITHKWFTFFGLSLVAGLATAGSMLLLGIPLIWVLPAIIIGVGIIYRTAIGVEPGTLDQVST